MRQDGHRARYVHTLVQQGPRELTHNHSANGKTTTVQITDRCGGCLGATDLDLSPANTPPGTRLAIGTAVIEITDAPHDGCRQFVARYGRDACVFVNTGEGKKLRLRGIYGRVVQDGRVSVGDVVRKYVAPKQASGSRTSGLY